MVDLVVSTRAEDELRRIWRVIAKDHPSAADRILLDIGSRLDALCDFPGLGTMRNDIRPGVRVLIEGNYLLLYEYREIESVVELVSVVDGRRDLKNWL